MESEVHIKQENTDSEDLDTNPEIIFPQVKLELIDNETVDSKTEILLMKF